MMRKATRWDVTDYLETEERIAEYYQAASELAAETFDFTVIMHTMDAIERARIRYGLA